MDIANLNAIFKHRHLNYARSNLESLLAIPNYTAVVSSLIHKNRNPSSASVGPTNELALDIPCNRTLVLDHQPLKRIGPGLFTAFPLHYRYFWIPSIVGLRFRVSHST